MLNCYQQYTTKPATTVMGSTQPCPQNLPGLCLNYSVAMFTKTDDPVQINK